MTNKNYLYKTDKGDFVVRFAGNNSNLMINRKNEISNSQLVEKLGINAKIYDFDINSGIKITGYIPDALTLNPKNVKDVQHIIGTANLLKTLHSSNLSFDNEFNVFAEFEHYNKILDGRKPHYPSYEKIEYKFKKLSKEKLDLVLLPCHNDPVAENFIFSQRNHYLIDWEYSGMNDPHWDLAAFIEEAKLEPKEQILFLNSYFNNDNTLIKNSYKKLLYFTICQNFLWSVWTAVKEEVNNKEHISFGRYGIDRFNRAVSLLDEYEKTYGKL